MAGREVLGANTSDAVEVGEIVNDEVAGFPGLDLAVGFGIEDEVAAPGWEAMTTGGAGGVGLAGELGHAVFVVEVLGREIEEGGEVAVEIGFGEGVRGAFVATGLEEMRAGGERDGAEGFDEVEEGEGGAHEEEGLRKGLRSTRSVFEEGSEVEFGISKEEM